MNDDASPLVRSAYRQCKRMVRVRMKQIVPGFWLLPDKYKLPLAALFAFEYRINSILYKKSLSKNRKLTLLDQLETDLHLCLMGDDESDDPVIIALTNAVVRYALEVRDLTSMIDAGRVSLENNQFEHFADLITYCQTAANPQGALVMSILDESDEKSLACTKAITTSLFLMDKYQHISAQYKRTGSIFLPKEDMQRFNVTESELAKKQFSFNHHELMKYEYARIDKLLRAAAPLGKILRGRVGMVARMLLTNSARKLYHLKSQKDLSKPVLTNKGDWKYIMKAALH